jgi:hypothetical protein
VSAAIAGLIIDSPKRQGRHNDLAVDWPTEVAPKRSRIWSARRG